MADQLNENPVLGTVRLANLDARARREVKEKIRSSLAFAAAMTDFEDWHRIAGLAEAIAEEMIEETAPDGLAIGTLCERAQTSDGHVRGYFDAGLRDLIDIAVRALLLMTNRSPIHQYMRSQPVRVGKDSHAIGIDHEAGAPHVVQLLVCTLSCCDRNLINQADWLLTGTHDDRTSPRADRERIAAWEAELMRKLPGSLQEHLESFFTTEDGTREDVTRALKERAGREAFVRHGVDPERFVQYCYPRCLILDKFSVGRPRAERRREFTKEVFPGDEPEVIEAVEDAGRYGVARCRLEETKPRMRYGAVEDQLLPALSKRLGEDPKPVPPRRLGEVAEMHRAQLLGIGANIRQVHFWRFPKSEIMLRAMQSSLSGGQYIDTDLWRTIRLDDEHQRVAVALLERAQQVWPQACIERYRKELQPGKMQPSSALARFGLLKSSLIASAAGVSAHRDMELRHYGE